MLATSVAPYLNIRDLIEFSMAIASNTSENCPPLMSCNWLKYLNLHSDQQSNLIQIALKTSVFLYDKYTRLDENLSIFFLNPPFQSSFFFNTKLYSIYANLFKQFLLAAKLPLLACGLLYYLRQVSKILKIVHLQPDNHFCSF